MRRLVTVEDPIGRPLRHPGQRKTAERLKVFRYDHSPVVRIIDAIELRGPSTVYAKVEAVEVHRVFAVRDVDHAPPHRVAHGVREARRMWPDLAIQQEQDA